LEFDPKDKTARYQRALVNYRLKRYQNSVSDLSFLIDNFGANPNYLKYRGLSYMKLRNFDPCRNDLQAAINIKENDPELHY